MELNSRMIKQTREKNRAFSQITLDDDYIVKDNKPDVIKIIHTDGTIVFEETKLTNQSLWINGKLEFRVLYRSDDDNHKLEVLSGSIPFQEKLVMEGAQEMDPIRVSGELEDLSVGIINSRKLSIRAVANLKAVVEEQIEEEIAGGLEDDAGCQQKVAERELLNAVAAERDIIRFHNEITLPTAKPNINRILWSDVRLRGTESSLQNGKLHIQGDVYVSVLYAGDEEDQVQWLETVLPFSSDVEGISLGEEPTQILWVKIRPESVEIEPRNDYDGELRVIGIDISFAVDYKIWSEKKIPVLLDAYSLNRQLLLKKEKCASMCFQMKNEAKVRLTDTVAMESNQEKILQICSCTAKVTIDRATPQENGVLFEGIVTVHILYLTAEDNFPIAHTQVMLPFEQLVEVTGMQTDTWFDYTAGMDMVTVNLLDSSEFEVKTAFRIAVLAFSENCFEKIAAIDTQPLNMEELTAQPGLVGYIVQEKEELWDIAKRYHTTMDEIAETNNRKIASIRPGTKLIIVKKISV